MNVNKTTKKTRMTDAEIKEAIRRDKEWMDDIDSDEGIVVPKGALKDIFGCEDDEDEDEEDSFDGIDIRRHRCRRRHRRRWRWRTPRRR